MEQFLTDSAPIFTSTASFSRASISLHCSLLNLLRALLSPSQLWRALATAPSWSSHRRSCWKERSSRSEAELKSPGWGAGGAGGAGGQVAGRGGAGRRGGEPGGQLHLPQPPEHLRRPPELPGEPQPDTRQIPRRLVDPGLQGHRQLHQDVVDGRQIVVLPGVGDLLLLPLQQGSCHGGEGGEAAELGVPVGDGGEGGGGHRLLRRLRQLPRGQRVRGRGGGRGHPLLKKVNQAYKL